MQNLHAIHIKYMPATDHRSSRIKLTSKRFAQSITINRDYSVDTPHLQAAQHLIAKGFSLVGVCDEGNIILTSTFAPIK